VKSKAKFLPLIAFAAVLVSLVFIIPVFSATGTVRFVDSADTTKDQAYGRQGGNVLLEVADSDLNVAVKRVLLPVDYTENGATAAVVSGSATITMSTTTSRALATATSTASLIAPGDTIAIGSDTVRTVTSVNMATAKVIVNKAFTATNGTAKINKVTQALGLFAVCPTCALAEKVTIAAGAAGNATIATFFGLAAVPIADSGSASTPMNLANRFTSNADTVTNTSDVFLADSSGSAIVAASTTVTFVSGIDAKVDVVNDVAGMIVYAVYWGGAKNDTGTLVKATSNSDPTGITVALTETGPTTGVFRLSILATSSASNVNASTPQLQVGANDSIVLKYTDASPAGTISKSLTIETTNPIFSNLLPADGTAGQASRPVVEADITDGDSGVNNKLVRVIFAVAADGTTIDASPAPQDVDVKGTGVSLDAITSGFRAKQRLPQGMAPSTDATIFWWVKSTDTAGNIGISDRQPTISSVADTCDSKNFSAAFTAGSVASLAGKKPGTTADVKGCQPFSVKVDFGKPTIASAKTGTWWDSEKTTTDKTETNVTKAKNTSIMVVFNEELDGTTVQTADFEVAGVAPVSAEWFSGAKKNVFLTVPAMTADERPKVELVGNVSDVAGNAQTAGKVDNAADGIAPSLTVTLTGTGTGSLRPVTADKITINIISDEDVGQPVVTLRKLVNETLTGDSQLGATTTPTAVLTAARTYKAEATITTPGLYSVYVTAADATAQNKGTKGLNGSAAISIKSDTTGLLFEVDTAVAAPTIGPASTDDSDTFIRIEFTGEGTEYKSASAAAADYDSADTVTITSASLNGVDITPLATADNKSFLHKTTGLAVGDHKVKVKAKDLAGKEKEFSGTVKVVARSDFKLPLNPGWNLVSLPGEPSDAAIDSVIPSTHPVSTVLTYDPAVPGGWLTAVRGGDGKFAGTLNTISATRAYWMLTNSFEAINVAIPRLASGAAVLPPTIAIVQGWNFVPVLDVTGDKAAGATASTTSYASGVSESRVWTFDTVNNKWVDVTTGTVSVGSGYWLYATKAGTLIP
jgi:hypothetical protein